MPYDPNKIQQVSNATAVANAGPNESLPGGLYTAGGGRREKAWHNEIFGGGQDRYTPDPRNFDPQAIGAGWGTRTSEALHGVGADQNDANVQWARGLGGRDDFRNYLTQLQSRPLDSYALGRSMMQQGQQQVAGNMAAQMASAPGRFNPAAMRAAQMGMSSAGQNMALQAQQQAMAAAVQERAARDAALAQGWGKLNDSDIQRLLAEQGQRANDQKFWGARQALGQGWQGLGLQEKQMDAASRRAYEQMAMAGYLGKDVPSDPAAAQVVGTLASAAGTLLSGGSDERLKENIRPARHQACALLDALAKGGF